MRVLEVKTKSMSSFPADAGNVHYPDAGNERHLEELQSQTKALV